MQHLQDDRNAYLEAWAEVMINIWQDRMIAFGVRDTGELLNSLQTQVHFQSNGDIGKITHTYLHYGRFVDMGVGRGVPLSQAGPGSGRKRRPWYNRPYYRSIKVLTEKMAEIYGEEFQAIISEALAD